MSPLEDTTIQNNTTQQTPDIEAQKTISDGRTWSWLPKSSDDESAKSSGGIGICGCVCLAGLGLMIAGGIVYAVGNSSCDDPERECSQTTVDTGKYLMIAGGSLILTVCACGCCVLCCAGAVVGAMTAANIAN